MISGPLDLPPTLGPQVANFINTVGVHGPGDVIGQPFRCSGEELAFLYRVYELVPDPYRPGRLRRRYRRGIYCRRKGLRKSEFMSLVAFAEFDGPVRWSGRWAEGGERDEWGYVFAKGEPIGERVTSPEIPFVATTEEQTEKLAWGVFRYILQASPLSARYQINLDEIFFAGQPKEAGWCYLIPPTNSDAADGAKPTFVPREEAHLWTSRPLRATADVIDRNLVKRQAADPWTMDASTMYAPGEGSVLESSMKSIKAGDESILMDLRQASDEWDLDDDDQWLEAVREASGPDAWPWTNIAAMRSEWLDPEKSRAQFCRFWLNQARAIENKPFSGDLFDLLADPKRTPAPSSYTNLVVFLDGSLTRDATALICWTLEDRPHLFLAGMWERPNADYRQHWHVPRHEVIDRVAELIASYGVVILGGDSDRYWSPQLVEWADKYGKDRVVPFPTRHGRLMHNAIERFESDWQIATERAAEGVEPPWTHDGSDELRRHFASTIVTTRLGSRVKILAKESDALDAKIDGSVAAIAGYAMVPDAKVKVAELRPPEVGIY